MATTTKTATEETTTEETTQTQTQTGPQMTTGTIETYVAPKPEGVTLITPIQFSRMIGKDGQGPLVYSWVRQAPGNGFPCAMVEGRPKVKMELALEWFENRKASWAAKKAAAAAKPTKSSKIKDQLLKMAQSMDNEEIQHLLEAASAAVRNTESEDQNS
jgi:hypothetical protein